MAETLASICGAQGVVLDATYSKLFDGTILRNLIALLQKDGPLLAPIMPQLLAMIAAGNYLGAFILIVETLASGAPTTAA